MEDPEKSRNRNAIWTVQQHKSAYNSSNDIFPLFRTRLDTKIPNSKSQIPDKLQIRILNDKTDLIFG